MLVIFLWNIQDIDTHNEASFLDITSKLFIFGQEPITRMNHVHIVSLGDPDNLVTSKISSNRCELAMFANDVCFVSFLSVHTKTVFPAVHSNSVQRKLVGRAENADGDFTTIGDCLMSALVPIAGNMAN
jgi:hypothetical protein